jgi:hypothetical protein
MFEWYLLFEFDISHVYFFWQDLSMGTNRFALVTLVFDPHIENLNHAFSIFWFVYTGTLIFHISICCDKSFQWVPISLTLWPWTLCLIYLLKTLSLAISFECYTLEFWYFTWVFVVTKPFRGYQQVRPWPLWLTDLQKNFNLGYKFWMVCTKTLILLERSLRQDLPLSTNRFDLVTLVFDLHIGCVHNFTSGKDDVCTNGYYWYHCLPKVLLVASELWTDFVSHW